MAQGKISLTKKTKRQQTSLVASEAEHSDAVEQVEPSLVIKTRVDQSMAQAARAALNLDAFGDDENLSDTEQQSLVVENQKQSTGIRVITNIQKESRVKSKLTKDSTQATDSRKVLKVTRTPHPDRNATNTTDQASSMAVATSSDLSTLTPIQRAALFLFGDDADFAIDHAATVSAATATTATAATAAMPRNIGAAPAHTTASAPVTAVTAPAPVSSAQVKIMGQSTEREQVIADSYRFSLAYLVEHNLLPVPVSRLESVQGSKQTNHTVQFCSVLNLLQDYLHSAFCAARQIDDVYEIEPQDLCDSYQQLLKHEAIFQQSTLKQQQKLSEQRQEQCLQRSQQPVNEVNYSNVSIMPFAAVRGSPLHWGPILYNTAEFIFAHRHQLTEDLPEFLQLRERYEQAVHSGAIEYNAQLQSVLWPIKTLFDDADDFSSDDISALGVQVRVNTAAQGASPVWKVAKAQLKAKIPTLPTPVKWQNKESKPLSPVSVSPQQEAQDQQGWQEQQEQQAAPVSYDHDAWLHAPQYESQPDSDFIFAPHQPEGTSYEAQLNAFISKAWPRSAAKSPEQLELEEQRQHLLEQERLREESARRSRNMEPAMASLREWLPPAQNQLFNSPNRAASTHGNAATPVPYGEQTLGMGAVSAPPAVPAAPAVPQFKTASAVATPVSQPHVAWSGAPSSVSSGAQMQYASGMVGVNNAFTANTVAHTSAYGVGQPSPRGHEVQAAQAGQAAQVAPAAVAVVAAAATGASGLTGQYARDRGREVKVEGDGASPMVLMSAVPQVTEPNYRRTESAASVQKRHEASFKLIKELGLVTNDYIYQQYCKRMEEQGLKPFAQEYLIKLNLARVFIEKGYLAQRLDHYTVRSGQLAFINQVEIALARKQILMVEASTGIGKTFSYLVPPILGARRVVVSTATKALQDQLIKKDLPNLVDMLTVPRVHYMALKGQTNYICRYLLEGGHSMGLISRELVDKCNRFVAEELDKIRLDRYQAGFGEIRFSVDELDRKAITCDSKLCSEMYAHCPFAQSKHKYTADDSGDNDPNDHCFVAMSRQEARTRNVVAINHALFFANEALDNNFLQSDVVIFDEAHSLPDICRDFFSQRMALGTLEDLPKKMQEAFKDKEKGKGKSKSETESKKAAISMTAIADELKKYVVCTTILARVFRVWFAALNQYDVKHQDSFRLPLQRLKYMHRALPSPLQLLGTNMFLSSELETLGEKSKLARANAQREEQDRSDAAAGYRAEALGAGAGNSFDLFGAPTNPIPQYHSMYEQMVARFRQEASARGRAVKNTDALEDALVRLYLERLQERHVQCDVRKGYQEFNSYNKIDYEVDVLKDSFGRLMVEPLFRALMGDLWTVLAAIKDFLAKNADLDSEKIGPVKDLCAELANFIPAFMNADRDKNGAVQGENVSLFDFNAKGFTLQVIPLDVSERLGEILRGLQQRGVSVVLTSATITIENSFDKYCRSLGLKPNETVSAIVNSSFDYPHNACLMISENFPSAASPQRIAQGIEQIAAAIEASPGGVFFLTTSYHAMKQARDILQRMFGTRRQVMMQGEKTIEHLMNDFKQDGRAILVGTSSFWEGVDVPGKALSLVIIDKLPFKQITDPVLVARDKLFEMQKRSFFEEELLPDAVIKLRQGVGRLIRNENDKGCLIIMDPRMVTKSYGHKFVNSLPPMRIVNKVQELVSFFKSC